MNDIFLTGFMFDAFGSYNSGFILMGCMITLSGLMLYPVPYIQTILATKVSSLDQSWYLIVSAGEAARRDGTFGGTSQELRQVKVNTQ